MSTARVRRAISAVGAGALLVLASGFVTRPARVALPVVEAHDNRRAAGTFIYHTHLSDVVQLTSGM